MAFLYAGSGYLGIHVEHLNQLQALAWLPLMFWGGKRKKEEGRKGRGQGAGALKVLPSPVSVFALTMIVLAGHTQMAFIAVVGLVVWRVRGCEVAGCRD